ncbi:MAG: GUN4 domain-containing protein [Dolichospermum sp. DET50]|nr:GUN4 domain-containing protein [Dolichospermum sp. DET66]MBS3033388.1 GUN4 domain-containing protein [Dolichospermum sp. DET67]MBS3038592.1 GUN4 domain-containing protein [Dolichospermum sp. DET50]QSX65876.1 MAG: GUN4 domain-containing protein [Dolichospermum sp. DET69]
MAIKYDIFLSHASEDKETFVEELCNRLKEADYTVWYDKNELWWGNHLKTKIKEGLDNSQYGIVVISKHYFSTHKEWTFQEFNHILTDLKILPILHHITMEDIRINHPEQYEKIKNWKAISSDKGIDYIIEQSLKEIGNRWSEKEINYSKLRNLLAAQKWKEADEETYEVMIKAVGKKSGDCFTRDELLNFPCQDLRTIDRLWVQYSKGRFGFSVQKEIYLSVGGRLGRYESETFLRFYETVGWGDVIKYNTLPDGHLPIKVPIGARGSGVGGRVAMVEGPMFWVWVGISSLASRLVKCNI